VSNANGKVSTTEKKFEVTSTLTVGINISPRATPIGSSVGFQARSPKASFYEWDFGDGTPSVNGTADFVSHVYKKTGIYTVNLGVKNTDGTEENRISRKVYITDTDKPYALIDIKNTNGSVVEDLSACENADGAFIINRADTTTIDASNSINTDGNSAGLDYTWEYMDRVKTGPSLSEKFSEL
jgi:PKD domain